MRTKFILRGETYHESETGSEIFSNILYFTFEEKSESNQNEKNIRKFKSIGKGVYFSNEESVLFIYLEEII